MLMAQNQPNIFAQRMGMPAQQPTAPVSAQPVGLPQNPYAPLAPRTGGFPGMGAFPGSVAPMPAPVMPYGGPQGSILQHPDVHNFLRQRLGMQV